MSIYSGKCDFFDTLCIYKYTLEEIQNKVKIYIGNNEEPLKVENMSDLIQYYPHIVICSYSDNAERKAVIHLSSESYVDREERECLEWRLEILIKIYNRCKRKKIEFDVDKAVKQITWNDWNGDAYRELARRVKDLGKKATIDGIHLQMQEIYRQELVKEMISNGINIADTCYKRFC